MEYTITDHIHNYAIWTAARASQRGFTTTANINAAINKTRLEEFAATNSQMSIKEFDEFHRATANVIMQHFDEMSIEIYYGRAAKIIAIYLKTAVVIRDSGQSALAKIIHPPIDNILLTNLSRSYKHLKLRGIKWTQLEEEAYFELIEKLRTIQPDNFW